jgi:alkylated DNA repair dioxygenase AlkB
MLVFVASAIAYQPSLLDLGAAPSFDPTFDGAARRFLGAGAWVEVVPGWVSGADALFDTVLAEGRWEGRERWMYERMVDEPRLTTGAWAEPPEPSEAMAGALSGHYGLDLSAVSANLYRDGRDSVAWHGDTAGRHRSTTVVAILSLGAPRTLMLRPKGGGPSVRHDLAGGDLLVMGGTCQQTWEHAVPKRAAAGARISLMFREPGVF